MIINQGNTKGRNVQFSGISGIIGLVIFIAIVYFLIKGLYAILSFVAIALAIITLIIDYKVFIDHFKFILGTLKQNPLMGLIMILFNVIAYPFTLGYLFLKAIGKKYINKQMEKVKQERNRYEEYEEVKEKKDDFLQLPKIDRPQPVSKSKDSDNEYQDLFK